MADELEHLAASAHDGPHAGGAAGDDAGVRRQCLGLFEAQQLRIELRLGRCHTRLSGLFLGQVLVDLLGTEGAAALHGTGTLGIGCCLCRIGLRFGQGGTRQGHVGLHALGGKAGQHLTLLHAVTYVGMQLGHAQAAGFGAHTGFLPGGHAAIGREFDGQVAAFGLGQ